MNGTKKFNQHRKKNLTPKNKWHTNKVNEKNVNEQTSDREQKHTQLIRQQKMHKRYKLNESNKK